MKTALLLLCLYPSLSLAAIFDAADILPNRSGAIGVQGELLLSNPTSEGVEAKARYGLSDDWNLAGIIGTGSKNKKLRLGGEAVFNLVPDWEGQFGISFLSSMIYINRGSGGLLTRLAILLHKKIDSFSGLPANLYVAFPFIVEARRSTYTTGSQFVFGSLWDVNSQSRLYIATELGIKIGKSESYALLGAGFRLGELRFQKRDRPQKSDANKTPKEPEYREEDFL